MTSSEKNINQLIILGSRYAIAVFGIYISSKLVFMLVAIAATDFGLDSPSNTWIWIVALCIYLILILYLVLFFLLKTECVQFSSAIYVAPIVLASLSIITLLIPQKNKDCIATEAFMACSVAAMAQLIILFSFFSFMVALASKRNAKWTNN